MTDTATDETTESAPEPEPRQPCLCGCGEIPVRKRSRFIPGHDAQLKSRLYAAIRNEDTPEDERAAHVATLDGFGWPQPAPKRSKAKAKAEATEDETETEG